MQLHLKTTAAAPVARAHLAAFVTAAHTHQQHLASARACLLGARDRLATFRRHEPLNSNDRDLHADAVLSLYFALDLVWEAQQVAA